MKRWLLPLMFVMVSGFFFATAALAEVGWEVQTSVPLPETPVASAVSPDAKRIFVLTEKGDVLIYSPQGTLEETMPIGQGMDTLDVMPGGDRLLLQSRREKTLKIYELAFIQKIDITGDPFKGPASAPVTIVVFDDFQCPFCARLDPLLKEVFSQYPEKVKLVLKQFPLNIHPLSRQAALASLSAFRQGKFWEYHDLLFANYNKLTEEKLREFARGLGLDMKRFEAGLQDRENWIVLNKDVQDGVAAEVRGTPTIFINGRLLKDRSLENFHQVIDEALEKSSKMTTGEISKQAR
jgi:protein-disulfide isomerase